MKRIIFIILLITTAFPQHTLAQDSSKQSQLFQLLTLYYSIKDALVNSDVHLASLKAVDFVKTINSIDTKSMKSSESDTFVTLQNKLAFDARHISETKELNHQREHFKSLSDNIYTLAKAVKLSSQPVYQAYCPMKKAYWLSADKEIKNPYYGSSMLTCGKVTKTLQ